MDESESDDGYSDVSGKYLYLADGGRIRLTRPRFRKALQQTGIILEELFEVPQDKFFRGDWELAEREWEAYDGKRHGPSVMDAAAVAAAAVAVAAAAVAAAAASIALFWLPCVLMQPDWAPSVVGVAVHRPAAEQNRTGGRGAAGHCPRWQRWRRAAVVEAPGQLGAARNIEGTHLEGCCVA